MVHHDAAAGAMVCAMRGFDRLYDAFRGVPLSIASMQVIVGLCSTGLSLLQCCVMDETFQFAL